MEVCITLAILLSYHKATRNQPTVATKDGVLCNLYQKSPTEKIVETETTPKTKQLKKKF